MEIPFVFKIRSFFKGFYLLILLLAAVGMQAQTIYRLKVRNYSPKAVGSCQQRVLTVERQDSATLFTVCVTGVDNDEIGKAAQAFWVPTERYAPEIAAYLEATSLINKELPEIGAMADSLFGTEKETLRIVKRGLSFVSRYLAFDDSLALEISNGTCRTQPVETILKRKKGTCSEYTNLFIALMRRKQIPARFVAGYIYMPTQNFSGCHAWAECYINGYGWLPVDPQNALLRFPTTAVKLFSGKDFEDCGLKAFTDLVPLEIEITK